MTEYPEQNASDIPKTKNLVTKIDQSMTANQKISSSTMESAKELTQRDFTNQLKKWTESVLCKYNALKTKYFPSELAKEIFSQDEYLQDYSFVLKPKPSYTIEPYKQKIKNFTPEIIKTFSKDISKYSGKHTLCLGLENVLMIVSTMAEKDANEIIPIFIDKTTYLTEISLYYRPYLFEFLNDMANKYELILYSSLNDSYVRTIFEGLQKDRKYFEYCFSEEFCVFANLSYGVKCLDFLYGNRDPSNIIFVDTTVKALPFSPDNFVPIPSYFAISESDKELIKLGCFLDELSGKPNIASSISNIRKAIIK